MKSILPEYINISLYDAFISTKHSFEAFNKYMQSKDLQELIDTMDKSPKLFNMWKQSLNKALQEAHEKKS